MDINTIELKHGSHESPQAGLCVMEAVAYIKGEPHSDRPACACPVVTAFAVNTNDWMDDAERQLLRQFILRIAGSKTTPEIEQQRAYMCADYAVRVYAPIGLRAAGFVEQADKLAACRKIVDKETAEEGRAVARAAADAAAITAASASASASASANAASAAIARAADAAFAADAAAAAAAEALADADAEVRSELVTARLALLDEMLKLTDEVQS